MNEYDMNMAIRRERGYIFIISFFAQPSLIVGRGRPAVFARCMLYVYVY